MSQDLPQNLVHSHIHNSNFQAQSPEEVHPIQLYHTALLASRADVKALQVQAAALQQERDLVNNSFRGLHYKLQQERAIHLRERQDLYTKLAYAK
jgi:hypothetical protein